MIQRLSPDEIRTDEIRTVKSLIVAKLEAAGATDIGLISNDRGLISIRYTGYDDDGFAAVKRTAWQITGEEFAPDGNFKSRHKFTKVLDTLKKQREKFKLLPPVDICEHDFSLHNLQVSAPLAWRLRADYGDEAKNVLRLAIRTIRDRRYKKTKENKVAHDITINNGFMQHREALSETVSLKTDYIVAHDINLPETLINTIVGSHVSAVCVHPVLCHPDILVTCIQTATKGSDGAGRLTLFRLNVPWVPAEEI